MSKKNATHNDFNEEIRSLKHKYNVLLENVAAIEIGKNSNITDTLVQIQTILSECDKIEINSLLNPGDKATLSVLDVNLLKKAHQLVNNAISEATNTNFNEEEYAERLLNIMGPEMNWDKLSPYFLKGARILNGTPSMLGTFKMDATVTDINTQQKKMRLKQDKAETTKQQQPLCEKSESKPNNGVPFIKVVFQHLVQTFKDNENTPIPYYVMICDPFSFSNTIDNMFQLSFLFNDDKIYFGLGKDTLPTVCLVLNEMKNTGSFVKHHHFVSSMDQQMWQKMVDFYGIKKPFMNIDRDAFYNRQ